ncbi:diacylglycerol kinase 1 isoform X2 [Neodiprion fabricii]|uniref:diacylglycerol kinase 1 isoform X2 n=1 Tax=Neodiprion fabricii TaxID=2872261 RepID=UPI001ED950AA|nr:diacylglycerol kinase 1 isoform X2 [Neodiprion fabricii]
MTLQWDKLSPAEFQQLQDLAAYSPRKLQDVLATFCGSTTTPGGVQKYHPDGVRNFEYLENKFRDIDYDGFRKFLDSYLEVGAPDELARHLFLSFVKKGPNATDTKALKEMAVLSSTTACAVITSHTTSNTNVNSTGLTGSGGGASESHCGGSSFVDKFHGLTEKLQALGHHRSDSETSARARTGSVHPMLTVTHTSYSCHDVLEKKSTDSSPSHSQMSRNSSRKSNNSLFVNNGKLEEIRHLARKQSMIDVHTVKVSLKDIVCYLSLLEAGRPEDKLEFMFRLYDTDGNGVLDRNEIDCIVNQMMNVAEYLGWDVTELKPILQDMMIEIDYDSDGTVSLDEWKRGGLTTIPLLVLLGLDSHVKEDGNHLWKLKHFSKPAYCNLCLNMLVGLGKKGLSCVFCKYTVHERCVQRAPASCIATYVKSKKTSQTMAHHWVEGNCHGKCSKCRKTIKSYNGITGLHCRWCQITLHNRCVSQVRAECTLGEYAAHILPPTAICPVVIDRQRSLSRDSKRGSRYGQDNASSTSNAAVSRGSSSNQQPAMSFQITLPPGVTPLAVFINPKSGGRQGEKMLRKFQYILNPRQVHNLATGGPMQGLQMFKDVENFKVICCGGDGTVGWILETMDHVQFLQQPAVGVIPLGTGNDLARCLRWGGGYEGEAIYKVLKKIEKATPVMMDRWQIEMIDQDEERKPNQDSIPYNIINNYFSVGVDAAICVKFHLERERNPEKFNSRMKNKLWYFEYATSEQFAASCKNLHEDLEIICDDIPLDLAHGPSLQGVALLNIPFTHGGSNLWGEHHTRHRLGKRRKRPDKELSTSSFNSVDLNAAIQDIGDNLIEVIGLENCLHMGQVKTGLRASGRRLAQCSSVKIKTTKRFPMQIDGEPWMQGPCTIHITHKNQVPMLMAPPPEKSKGFFRFLKRKVCCNYYCY